MSDRHVICADLSSAIDDLKRQGFRLDIIFPADDPQSAVLSRADESVRLSVPGTPTLMEGLPSFQPEFVLARKARVAGMGRGGMSYRDLIPGRLGGRYIASQISIPGGGPVADWVHYHRLAVQLIYVVNDGCGWCTKTKAIRS